MADAELSITIRDTLHPCGPYQTTSHSFLVQIYHCDGTPLFWKGVNYNKFPLDVKGLKGGFIHGQVRVPHGCYLVRAIATCKNVISDWAWVEVCCAGTVCVDLVMPNVIDCIRRVQVGMLLGTVDPPQAGEQTVVDIAQKEVNDAVKALDKVAAKLPKEGFLPEAPSADEVRRLTKK